METFKGENLREVRSFVAIHESFLHEIWRFGIIWRAKSEPSAKVFSMKIYFSPIHGGFLP